MTHYQRHNTLLYLRENWGHNLGRLKQTATYEGTERLWIGLIISIPSRVAGNQHRIIYKLNTLCHKCIISLAPEYLSSCLHLYTPPRIIRSSSDTQDPQNQTFICAGQCDFC